MRTLQTFVVRILSPDDFGSELHGQISEPASADEWRASFSGVQELFDQILIRLAAEPQRAASEPVVPLTDANPSANLVWIKEPNE